MLDITKNKHQEVHDEILNKIEMQSIRKMKRRKQNVYEYFGLDTEEGFDEKSNKHIKSDFRKFMKDYKEDINLVRI